MDQTFSQIVKGSKENLDELCFRMPAYMNMYDGSKIGPKGLGNPWKSDKMDRGEQSCVLFIHGRFYYDALEGKFRYNCCLFAKTLFCSY